jgi:hypothetical protein
LGPHFAAQHPAFGAQGLAAQQPFFAAQGAAAQPPVFASFAFLAFFGLAVQAPQLLREIGAHVADTAVGAIAMVRPPATASIVARLRDFVMCKLLKNSSNLSCYPWPGMGTRQMLMDSFSAAR